MDPDAIRLTINLEDHICSEGFPRVDFASLIDPPAPDIPTSTPNNSEISTAGGEALPPASKASKKKPNLQPNLKSGKTYKSLREQDFYEVAQGYDTDDSFVDDSEAHEDFAPFATKLVHGSFYICKGDVEFSHIPYESPEESPIFENPPRSKDFTQPETSDTSKEEEPSSPGGVKRSGSFVGNEGYMITPPKKSNKKRKESMKFSPKMVLKRSKSFKSQQAEPKPSLPLPVEEKIDMPILLPPAEGKNKPISPEKKASKTLFPAHPEATEGKTPQKAVTKPTPLTSSQPLPAAKKAEKSNKQVATPDPALNINSILLTKLTEANVLAQMELTPDCFTPGFYEKNNIHTFSSQIPDSLACILQLFFNHIQAIMSTPIHLNSQENKFERCLILGKIHAFLKRKQEPNLTESIQKFLAPFFLSKAHSLAIVLDTLLSHIQNAFISPPLQALITQIQPHIDRINENNSADNSQDEKQPASKKRFKWSFELKKLLGNSVAAQIEIEKNGFGVCSDKLSNEQIILQFLGSYVLPCWPKGRMKAGKLYKVTLPYHQHFTLTPSTQVIDSSPPLTAATSSPPISSNTKLGNWKLHISTGGGPEQHTKPVISNIPPKSSGSPTERVINRSTNVSAPVKIISPPNKIASPKSIGAHPNLLNPELIPVASLMPMSALSAKKSPLLKKTLESPKHREKSPNPKTADTDPIANLGVNKLSIVNKSTLQVNKSPNRPISKSPIPNFQSEIDAKSILPTSSYSAPSLLTPNAVDLIPANLLQNIRPNMLLPAGSTLFANNFTNSLPQTSDPLLNSSYNVLNTTNFGQNIAYIQTFPETIIHLKPGSNETSPKNAKSHSSQP